MKRRTFVAGLAATAGFPSAAWTQAAGSVPEIALFYTGPMASAESRARMIRDDLGADGFVDGKNFAVSISVANNNSDELPKLAKSLIRPSVKVILAIGPGAVRAAQAATTTIPIVAVDLETDPVREGLAQSLAHPGGNLTGLFFDFPEFSGKLIELLNEARPGLTRVAALWDPGSGSVQIEAAQAAASARGMTLQVLKVDDLSKLGDALAAAQAAQAQGLLVLSSPLFSAISGIKPVAEQTTSHGLAAITLFPEFAQNGGLMGYGPSLDDLYHQASELIAKVLRGEKAGDLPLERPSRFRLIVNLKAAKTLGLQLPSSLVARADEVVE
jgi:putative tryptophan/tyrosine transport system substrate-binding protein